MLWSDENVEAWHKPSPTSDLHVYQSQKQDDFLVVYQEQSEHKGAIHTRAYWLNKNQIRVTRQVSPVFARQDAVNHLPSVSVFNLTPVTTGTNQSLYAVYAAKTKSFTLYSNSMEIGNYNLPVYNKKRSVAAKVALTPLTITADTAMAAALAGLVVLIAYGSQQ